MEKILIVVNMLSILINFLGVGVVLVKGCSYLLLLGIVLFLISSILLRIYYPESSYINEEYVETDDGISI